MNSRRTFNKKIKEIKSNSADNFMTTTIAEEYRFKEFQRWMDYARYDWLEDAECEQWDAFIEQEVDRWMPLTFVMCVSVAGAVSEFLQEEHVKLNLSQLEFDYENWVTEQVAVACGVSGDISSDVMGKQHKSLIITAEKLWKYKNEGMPMVWLEVDKYIKWFKNADHAIQVDIKCNRTKEYCILSANRVLSKWGKEKTKRMLKTEINKFKRFAKKRDFYPNASESFFKQIGLIIVAYKVVKERYGLHTQKRELIEFIYNNITLVWHGEIVNRTVSNEERC